MSLKTAGGFDTLSDTGEVVKKYVPKHKNQIDVSVLIKEGKDVVLLVDADIMAYRGAATADGREYRVDTPQGTMTFKYKKDAVAFGESELEVFDKTTDIELKYIPEPEKNAIANVSRSLTTLRQTFLPVETQQSGLKVDMELYLTPKINFRNEVKSDYKANRKDLRRPTHLQACKKYLQDKRGAVIEEGYEADDLLCIRAGELIAEGKTPVICSIDKDLDQMSCFHYSWTKDLLYFIRPEEGLKLLYKQLLTGDATDNIPGLKGVGPKTAEKILKGCDGTNEQEMYGIVLAEYLKRTPRLEELEEPKATKEPDEAFALRIILSSTQNMRLLYLCRGWGDLWNPPVSGGASEDTDSNQSS